MANEFNGQSRNAPHINPYAAEGVAHAYPGRAYTHSGFADHARHRMPYRPPYRRDHDHDRDDFFYGGTVWPGWWGSYGFFGYPSFYEYPAWWDYDDSYDSPGYGEQNPPPQDYAPQPPDERQPESAPLPAWPAYNPPQEQTQSASPAKGVEPLQPDQTTVIVFNNGRPPEKIHNYLMTSATLYILDHKRHEIPLDQLDLAATEKVNREAGVDFRLPDSPK